MPPRLFPVMSDHDDLIAQFIDVAGVAPQEVCILASHPINFRGRGLNLGIKARQYLEAAQWNLPSAMTAFYNPPEETAGSQDEDMTNADLPSSNSDVPQTGGGRRLGDSFSVPQPIPTTSSSQSARPPKRAAAQKKFATLGDFGNDPHDDPNDSDYDDEKQDLFAGG